MPTREEMAEVVVAKEAMMVDGMDVLWVVTVVLFATVGYIYGRQS